VRLGASGEPPVEVSSGAIALLTGGATLANASAAPASFIVARLLPIAAQGNEKETLRNPETDPRADPLVASMWQRHGCHLNTGNRSCRLVGMAAACAIDASAPGCGNDRDGDGCTDAAEVQTGFDAYDDEDCVANAAGEPVVNCLFVLGDFACNGQSAAARDDIGCNEMVRMSRGLPPIATDECGGVPATPEPEQDCPPGSRDPACDGFAP
jgi:hypothetical protein